MKLIQRIGNLFRRGGARIGMVSSLESILDHPKINVDEQEFLRIKESLRMYRKTKVNVIYRNSKGREWSRDQKTANMMKDASGMMASLVFNEQCEIKIDDAFPEARDFMENVFDVNNFKCILSEYLEPMYALGGLVCRPYIDTKDYSVKFSWGLADSFFPLHSNTSTINEGAIPTVTTVVEDKAKVYYTLLEIHEWLEADQYQITHELYRSQDSSSVGIRVPLSRLYDNLPEQVTINGLSRPNFVYLRPKGFNNINPTSPLGLGICDNSKDTIQILNNAIDQFNWEVHMGQRKIAISNYLADVSFDESGAMPREVFDDEENVFIILPTDQDAPLLQDLTSPIRSDDYIKAMNTHFRLLERELKFSPGTFSFDGKSVKTATEVVSEDSMTFRTRNEQVNNVERFIKELIISTLEIARNTVGPNGLPLFTGNIPDFSALGVDFDDGVFTDKGSQIEYYGKVRLNRLMPDREIMRRIFKVPEETAEQWQREMFDDERRFNVEHQQAMAQISMFGRTEL